MKINLIHKNIAILGFGKEGNSTLRFLQKNGILDYNIAIFDKNSALKIENFNGKIISGENYLDTLGEYDFIFKSPGISPYTNDLKKYSDKILTQTKIFYEYYDGKIISVTQTKGKSTTATLIYETLKNAGYNVKLVGNIGNPVLDEIDITKRNEKQTKSNSKNINSQLLDFNSQNYDFVVYELSSYMLEELSNHHSYISIIGNIYEDHLDWHAGFENYKNAKLNILKNAENLFIGSILEKNILNGLFGKDYKTFGENGYYNFMENDFFVGDEKVIENLKPKIPGIHNMVNFSGILGVCDIVGVNFGILKKTIENFSGLPHRLENIGTFKGITFIDDAISTTPESTIEAIKTFGEKIGTIFLGGTDRGYNFEKLILELEKYDIKNLVLFPESSQKIKKLLSKEYNFIETKSMKEAVEFAFKNTKNGQVCLLSTASPSYSIWKNFEEKGDFFKKEVLSYKI